MPIARLLVEKVATLLDTDVVPSVVAPSEKVTVPVGVAVAPPDVEAIVAVKVTDWPTPAGFTEERSEVESAARVITSLSIAEVTEWKLESPLYCAVMLCVATASVLVLRVATPPLKLAEPREVLPSRKVTEPVGTVVTPRTPATVAVRVTDWLATAGFADAARVLILPLVFSNIVAPAK